MNATQERTIQEIKIELLERANRHSDTHEYKQFDIIENEYLVSLVTTIGGVGDEGTMAEVFARDHRHLFIGKRGGIKLANPGRFNKKTGQIDFCNKRVHGWKALIALTR